MKMEELGDSYEDFVFDRHYFPKKNDVSTLWKANFKKYYGEYTGPNMLLKLEELLKFRENNSSVRFKISVKW